MHCNKCKISHDNIIDQAIKRIIEISVKAINIIDSDLLVRQFKTKYDNKTHNEISYVSDGICHKVLAPYIMASLLIIIQRSGCMGVELVL